MRRGLHEPITPKVDGRAPSFVVRCQTCTFTCDVHAADVEDAIDVVRPRHQIDHALSAELVDLSAHPLYGGS